MTIASLASWRSSPAFISLAVAAFAYVASLVVLMRLPGTSVAEPLFLLGVLGIVFPLLAWLLTRGPRPAPVSTATNPMWPVLGYLALFAIVGLGWGFTALNAAVPDDPAQSVAQLALKLVTMVALPAWLFLRAGPQLAPFIRSWTQAG